MFKKILSLIVLVVVAEAGFVVFDIGRHWTSLNIVAAADQKFRADGIEMVENEMQSRKVFQGNAIPVREPIQYYALALLLSAKDWSGHYIDMSIIRAWDQGGMREGLQTLDAGDELTPFFHRYEGIFANKLGRVRVPGTHHVSIHDVVKIMDDASKAQYVLAGIEGRLALVPLAEYQRAGLPMEEK